MSDTFRRALDLLNRLRNAKLAFTLDQIREDAIMVEVYVPGERWEIEFVDYGDEVQVEIERFRSNGHIVDESALNELFTKYGEPESTPEEAVNHDDATARK